MTAHLSGCGHRLWVLMTRRLTELEEIAADIGYEWAMLLGSRRADWHDAAKGMAERDPLRCANMHATVELIWLHARVLYEFLFDVKDSKRASVEAFLDVGGLREWRNTKATLRSEELRKEYGRAHDKLFHMGRKRIADNEGLKKDEVIDELRKCYSACYRLMAEEKRQAFLNGLSHEWDIKDMVLG
jgi:hypothetical protein